MPKKKKKEDKEKNKDKKKEKTKISTKKKLLNEMVSRIGGSKAIELLGIIYGEEDVNEFLIAKKMNVTINDVRNILYKLSEHNLVSFIRKKDDDKGWYTYFWTLDEEKSLRLLSKRLEEKINEKKKLLRDRKEMTYYSCEECEREVEGGEALEQGFTCPECGEIYDVKDNSKEIEKLQKQIDRMKKRRKKVFKELKNIKDKRRKKKEKKKEKKKKMKKNARDTNVEEIKGIGKKKAKKFKKNRIKSIAGLLRLNPETVAEKVGISVDLAKKYQKRAKEEIS
ncbi:MAG: hypothetical protein ACOCRO_05650 [Halanaerobiales bacterium]